jgi:hypothetical protein
MDGYLSNMPDPSNESGTNSEEPTDDTEAHRERELGTSPHHCEVSTWGVLTSCQGTGTYTPQGHKRQKSPTHRKVPRFRTGHLTFNCILSKSRRGEICAWNSEAGGMISHRSRLRRGTGCMCMCVRSDLPCLTKARTKKMNYSSLAVEQASKSGSLAHPHGVLVACILPFQSKRDTEECKKNR